MVKRWPPPSTFGLAAGKSAAIQSTNNQAPTTRRCPCVHFANSSQWDFLSLPHLFSTAIHKTGKARNIYWAILFGSQPCRPNPITPYLRSVPSLSYCGLPLVQSRWGRITGIAREIELYNSADTLAWKHVSEFQKREKPNMASRLHDSIRREIRGA